MSGGGEYDECDGAPLLQARWSRRAPQGPRGPHRELARDRIQDEPESETTHQMISGEWLEALAARVRLHRLEWRVIALVLSSPQPVSASSVAKRLRLDYGLVKRVVRELVLWNILERTSGITFQSDHTRWGPPRPPSTT